MTKKSGNGLRAIAVFLALTGFFLYLGSSPAISLTAFIFIELLAVFLFMGGEESAKTGQASREQRRRARTSARSSARARNDKRPRRAKSAAPARRPRQRSTAADIRKHTLQAVRNTGRDPEDSPVRLLDIGLLVYFEGASDPTVYRSRDIPEQARAIRPFAIFFLNEKAHGPIGFEIYDGRESLLFREEEDHQFKAGKNPCFSKRYLRLLADHEKNDRWQLRLYCDNFEIAHHYFEWWLYQEIQLAADGEVSDIERRSFMESEELGDDISLDQLLSAV